jgi:hypothetical protein
MNAHRKSLLTRIVTIAVVAGGLAVLGSGCDGGNEGDRCVPTSLLSSDECGSGLSCQQIGGCGESYCCPSDPSKSSNAYCNASSGAFSSCPASDAGDDAASDAPVEASDGGAG